MWGGVIMEQGKEVLESRTKGADEKFCSSCGHVIKIAAEICPHCGVRQRTSGDKSKIAAGVLALCLGGIGIHKFYMGKPGMGILYLLFCWTLIPSLVGLIEGILYLTQSDERFASRLK
jgi:TM2 domain-containing membrane protein YozV